MRIHAAALLEYVCVTVSSTGGKYGTAADCAAYSDGGEGANHFDPPGFQRGRALRRS
jgi:hypothetical protein